MIVNVLCLYKDEEKISRLYLKCLFILPVYQLIEENLFEDNCKFIYFIDSVIKFWYSVKNYFISYNSINSLLILDFGSE